MKRRAFLGSTVAAGLAPRMMAEPGGESGYLTPDADAYEAARRPFNTCISHQPAFIAPCRTEAEVAKAVRFARSEGLPVTVKSGGHSFAGLSLADGALTLDMSGLRTSLLDARSHDYTAGSGLLLGEVSERLHAHGRLLPAGTCQGVGLAGLTLGGGYGFFARQFGLTCDHLKHVRMVDGAGRIIDSDDDPDLLWACRGGGNGNFGAITTMTFATRKAPDSLTSQRFVIRSLSQAAMSKWIETWFAMADELPNPIFSALVLNRSQITILLTSPYPALGPAFRKARGFLEKAGAKTKGSLSQPLLTALKRYSGRAEPLPFHNLCGGFYRGANDLKPCLEEISRTVQEHPGVIFQINTMGGAITRETDSPYPHRKFPYLGEIQAYWEDDRKREQLTTAAVHLRQSLTRAGINAHYRNYPDLSLDDWEESYFGESCPRLQALKKRFDPENTFQHAQSVRLPGNGQEP